MNATRPDLSDRTRLSSTIIKVVYLDPFCIRYILSDKTPAKKNNYAELPADYFGAKSYPLYKGVNVFFSVFKRKRS